MKKALALSPDNRFILRSAARLYIHSDEPDHAQYILNEQTCYSSRSMAPCFGNCYCDCCRQDIKINTLWEDILEGGKYPPFHVSELASALATLEFLSGSWRKARKLFQESLTDPNENSVAQSTWVRRWLPTLETDFTLAAIPNTYEARVWNAIRNLEWSEIVTSSQAWSSDEPFSSRPAELGSYAASVGLENYSLAETICKNARIANPNDLYLINNLAFALANQGKLDEADKVLIDLHQPVLDQGINVALTATKGLLCFRRGKIDAGRELYLEAISLAKKTNNLKNRALASIFYSREMLLVGKLAKANALILPKKHVALLPTLISHGFLTNLKPCHPKESNTIFIIESFFQNRCIGNQAF